MPDHNNLEAFSEPVNYDRQDPSDTGVAFYSALAQEARGSVLEIACGTGRVTAMREATEHTMQTSTKSIAVFGVGPGLGQAVARRYAREGYRVVLVARRRDPLEYLAKELATAGATAHVIPADLLWIMHHTKGQPEATYPGELFKG